MDWDLVARLAPGEVRLVGARDRRRSPRLAACRGREVYLRTGPEAPAQGTLRVVAHRALPGGRGGLRALVERVAAHAAAEDLGRRARRTARELAVGRRAAGVAHDLRNQLTLALLQLERTRAEAGGAFLDGLDALESVLCAARDLCASTLEGDGGGAGPARRPLHLRAVLVDEARAASALSRSGRRVRVRVRCPVALRVFADLAALARLVRNLVVNAVEASRDRGQVRVSGRALEDGRVELAVEDGGRGMAAADLSGLFAPGVSGGGGSGHGTTSLGECLEALGAEARLDTALGAGTRVRVVLAGVGDPDRAAVLLVDADRRRRRRRAADLAAAGWGTWGADGPAEGLAMARTTNPAAVLIARGTAGPGLAALRRHCQREGIDATCIPAGARFVGDPTAPPDPTQNRPAPNRPALINPAPRGSPAGTPG